MWTVGGQIKHLENLPLPPPSTSPDQHPWNVAIYRFLDENEKAYFKCAGTIIDKNTILTSVNCFLEDGHILYPSDVKVYVAPFQISAKMQKSRLYNAEDLLTHEKYNFYLDNNIAALKFTRDIEFNKFVQPICLPENTYSVEGKVGKVR